MENQIARLACPLCGIRAVVSENEISSVNCPNCGNYTYHLSVHPFLKEIEFRNHKILTKLSEMAVSAYKSEAVLKIDLEMYQKIGSNISGHT